MSKRKIPTRHPDHGYSFPAPRFLADVLDVAQIRESEDWVLLERPNYTPYNCVSIGPGAKHMKNWIELDYPAWDAETMPMPYPDDSIAAIFTAHTLDHLSPGAVVRLLAEAQRVLRDGGTFTCVVPHFLGQLAWECIEHKSRFGLKTWRNILENPMYVPTLNQRSLEPPKAWELEIGFNMLMAYEEANIVMVTQLIRRERSRHTQQGEHT